MTQNGAMRDRNVNAEAKPPDAKGECVSRLGVIAVIAILSLGVLICGLVTQPRYNDELFHLQVARQWYETGTRHYRPVLDNATEHHDTTEIFAAPMWHAIVAGLGYSLGRFSVPAAQVFQTTQYAVFLVVVYLLARQFFDRRWALFAMLVVGTMPIFIVVSIVLNLDMLGAVFAVTAMLFLFKNRVVASAAAVGGMWYAKLTAGAYIPAHLAASVIALIPKGSRKEWVQGLGRLLLACVVIGAICLWDVHNRISSTSQASSDMKGERSVGSSGTWLKSSYPSSTTSLKNWVRWLGLPFCAGVLGVLISARWWIKYLHWENRRTWIAITILVVFLFVYYYVASLSAIRYLAPILVLPAVAVAFAVRKVKWRWLGVIMTVAAVIQYVAVLGVVYHERRVNPDTHRMFSYLNTHLKPGEVVLTPEPNLIRFYVGQIAYWQTLRMRGEKFSLISVVGEGSIEQKLAILRKFNLRYLLVQKERIYSSSHETLSNFGWPESLLRQIEQCDAIEPVLITSMCTLYKVAEKSTHE